MNSSDIARQIVAARWGERLTIAETQTEVFRLLETLTPAEIAARLGLRSAQQIYRWRDGKAAGPTGLKKIN